MSGSSQGRVTFSISVLETWRFQQELLELRRSFGFDKLEERSRYFSTCEDGVLVTMCTYPGGFSTVVEAVQSLLFRQTEEDY